MADIYEILSDINNGLSETLAECGFAAVIPSGVEKGELPAVTDSGRITIEYKGENKALKIEVSVLLLFVVLSTMFLITVMITAR